MSARACFVAVMLAPSLSLADRAPPRTVTVHIESVRTVTLDRRGRAEGEPWVAACESPCDLPLPLDDEYRIVGEGIWPSGEFALEAGAAQRVVLHVSPATRAGRTAGVAVTALGLAAAVVGLYLVAVAASPSCSDCSHGATPAGWVLLAGGLVTAGFGSVLIFSNWRTGASQEPSAPEPAAPRAGASSLDCAAASAEARALERGAPRPATVPLWSLPF